MSRRPEIIVSQEDHEHLVALARQAVGRAPGAAMLLEEMERARVVEAGAVPAQVLAMNGRASFEYDGRDYPDYQLVYPRRAAFSEGRLSVLTPVGAALIGLAQGQTIWWPDAQGGVHRLTIAQVWAGRAH